MSGTALDDETRVERAAARVPDVTPDASVTIAASARTPWRTAATPPAPNDSSSVVVHTTRSPRRRTPARASASAANTIAPTPPFMSHAPRPYSRPSRTVAVFGIARPRVARLGGTTSTWPLSSRLRPPPVPANRAASCGRPSNAVRAAASAEVDVLGCGLPEVDSAPWPRGAPRGALQRRLVPRRVAERPRGRVERDQVDTRATSSSRPAATSATTRRSRPSSPTLLLPARRRPAAFRNDGCRAAGRVQRRSAIRALRARR